VTQVIVEFDAAIQSLAALNAAAYRLIGSGECRIEQADGRYLCHLSSERGPAENLRSQFLDFVTDENMRERVAARTEPVRNLILSLAFGSLASQPDKSA
jgi:His-Xaa-Ser system protein HxsD